ncbi:hypothetical protein EON80_30905, partial [bacterium]
MSACGEDDPPPAEPTSAATTPANPDATLPPMPEVHALDLSGLLLVAEEIIIGTLLGFSLQFLFQVFVVAGQIIAVQIGMSFAAMV